MRGRRGRGEKCKEGRGRGDRVRSKEIGERGI